MGESGCGKSTTARLILRLIEPTAGEVMLDGTDIRALTGNALKTARSDMQIIFQDPYASLDPRMRVSDIVAEPLVAMNLEKDGKTRRARVAKLLETVGPAARSRRALSRTSSPAASASASAWPGRWRRVPSW